MQIRIKREVPKSQEKSFEPIGCSKKEAARLLGVSVSTVHNMTKSGKLPCIRIGRRVLYSVKALREFLNAIDVAENQEIDGSTDGQQADNFCGHVIEREEQGLRRNSPE